MHGGEHDRVGERGRKGVKETLPASFGGDTKICWSLLSGVYGEVKDPTQGVNV